MLLSVRLALRDALDGAAAPEAAYITPPARQAGLMPATAFRIALLSAWPDTTGAAAVRYSCMDICEVSSSDAYDHITIACASLVRRTLSMRPA